MLSEITILALSISEGIEKFKIFGVIIAIAIFLIIIFTFVFTLDCFWCGKKFSRASRTRVDKGVKRFCCMKCFVDYDNKVDLYKSREHHEKGTVKIKGRGGIF